MSSRDHIELEDSEDVEEEGVESGRSMVEKLAEMDLRGGGQRVISVPWWPGWNLAKEAMVEALLGPECRIISGLPVLEEGSFWSVR